MTISYIDMGEVSSQDNKDYLIISTINKIIENQNNIGKIIDDKIIYHTNNINEDITKVIQQIEQLELKYQILNNNYQMIVNEINDIKDDYRRLNNDADSNYEVLVELNRRVDAITGETPGIPKQLQLNDNDTFIIMKTAQLKHIINTLTLLTDEMNNMIKRR